MRVCVLIAIASLLLCTNSFAATYVVNPAGTGDYKTIQGAVDGASAGDVIELTNGVFKGPGNADVTVDKDVTIRSQCGHPASCIIDGDRDLQNGGLTVSSSAIIDGITVRNVRGFGIEASGSAVIKNCMVTSCGTARSYLVTGGGIYCRDQSLVTGNLVTRNRGAGVACGGDAVVSSNVITYNVGVPDDIDNSGGGVRAVGSNPLVINNYIAWNVAGRGGGVFAEDGVRLKGNTIRKNACGAGFGPGVLLERVVWTPGVSVFEDNIIWSNSGGWGEEVSLWLSEVHVSHCLVQGGVSNVVPQPGDPSSIVHDDGGNINVDPLFETLHSRFRYLSPASPCVDAGSAAASSICFDGASGTQCMDALTTVSDQSLDTGTVDIGAHHLPIDYAYVPDSYSSIGSAIGKGHDLIIVRPGTYVENIDFGGYDVEVRSKQGPAVTEIIGLISGDYVVRFDSGECGSSILEGFTIRNDLSGGVYAGGILCDGSSPQIRDNVITDCSSASAGGIVCLNGGNALIENNEITLNQADRGAGIRLGPGCYPGIYGNEIMDNVANQGGGLYCEQSGPGLGGTLIRDNLANSYGGGVYLDYTPLDWTLSLCTIAGNTAVSDGGAVFFENCDDTRMARCTIVKNRAGTGAGLAILNTDVTVDNTIIAFSLAGEAVACSGSSATLSCSDVYANAGGDWIGCIAGQEVLRDNFSQHPEFCDLDNDDYRLSETSPCGVFQNCWGVGAWTSGCAIPAPGTWTVCPDGSGSFTTIQAAINVALDGDIIELCDGTFTGVGNRHLDYLGKAITVRSQSGNPAACIIDCQNASNGVWFRQGEGPGSVLQGITIRNGEAPLADGHEDGGAVRCGTPTVPASPTIDNCVFENNHANDDGGAVNVDPGSAPTITDCVIDNNTALDLGGGIHCTNASGFTISGCVIEHNDAEHGGGIALVSTTSVSITSCAIGHNLVTGIGGAVYSWSSTPAFTDCLFYWNEAAGNGGGVMVIRNSATFDRCTLYGNGGLDSGGISSYESASVVAQNTIIADSVNGASVYCTSGTIALTCSDLHDNADGDWVGCVAGQETDPTNISEDPLFCGPGADDFTLRADSPCAGPTCGQMGALGVGCASPPDIEVTPPSFSLPAAEGGTLCDLLEVANNGGLDLIWSSSTTDLWLSLSPGSGTVGPLSYAEPSVCVDATGLDPGSYSADIIITSNDPDEPTVTVPVNFTVFHADLGDIYLSGMPDQRLPARTGVVPFIPFHWYIVVDVDFADIGRPELNPTDGIMAWEASVNVPPEITVTARNLSPPSSTNLGGGDNFIVGTGTCLLGDFNLYTVVEYMAITAVDLSNVVVTLGPSSPSSFSPPEPGWWSCSSPSVPRAFAVTDDLVINPSFLVKPDGTGDRPNIQAAIDDSYDGYIIYLADGTYTGVGNRDLDYRGKAITLRSSSGNAEACIIDCNNVARGVWFQQGEGPSSVLRGVTICNGEAPNLGDDVLDGGAVRCGTSTVPASPTIEDCIFEDNHANDDGGGVSVDVGSAPMIVDCIIDNNSAGDQGGGVYCTNTSGPSFSGVVIENNEASSAGGGMGLVATSSVTITSCTIRNNVAVNFGGALYSWQSNPTVTDCLIYGNESQNVGGGIFTHHQSSVTVDGCTFYGNSASDAGGLSSYESSTIVAQNTIIAGSVVGAATYCTTGTITLTCCDLYGNAGGDWVGCIAGQFGGGNISQDPLFCGPAQELFGLDDDSPCQPANNSCGVQIGALGIECHATAAPEEEIPTKVVLTQNHPNPFNPRTVIQFGLPQTGMVDLAIFDVRGRRVRHLIDALEYPAGMHEIQWNGTDDSGRAMGSGIYIYRLETAGEIISRKMTLLQ